MDLYEAIQQQAMLAVVHPDDDAWLRHAFRYYSKTFATPLHLVQQLPTEDVLRAFFEDVFEQMDEEAREERIEWLLMTPEERRDQKDGEVELGARDDTFFDNLNREVAEGETISRKPAPGAAAPQASSKLAALVERTKRRAAKLAGVQLPGPKVAPAAPPKKGAPPEPPPTLGELPEFKVEFGRASNLGGSGTPWDNLDPLAPPPKAKKS